ncbi:hypothetical protein D3C75_1236040 [compost metagenome]
MLVIQVFDMNQDLAYGFLLPLRLVELAPRLVQEQHRHKEGVNPKLAIMQVDSIPVADGSDGVLEAAFFGFRQLMNEPVRMIPA